MAKDDRTRAHRKYRGIFYASGALALVLVAILLMSLHHRSGLKSDAQERARNEAAGRKVDVTVVKESDPERLLSLIGETRPFYSVTLYARVSGYLDRLAVDIGDKVVKGQLLAHVESPEQEQAYYSAKADELNKSRIAYRAKILRKKSLISQQQEEQAVADAEVSAASLDTQGVIRGYQNITAPFDGIISNRFVDLGWLLQNASGSQAASQPLFTLSKTDRLRVFMYVDQKDAPYVRAGNAVKIAVAGQEGSPRQANVSMVSGELDPRTRTLLTEVIVDNADGKIVAGSFVQAELMISTPRFMTVPIQALVMKGGAPFLSVIDGGGTTHLAKIDLAENDGENILIRSGVRPGQQVAINVGHSIAEGQKIQPVTQAAGQEAGQEAGKIGEEPTTAAKPSGGPR